MNIHTNIDHLSGYKKYLEVVRSIHEYLRGRDYLELDLPSLSPALIPESYLEVFETEYRYFDKREKLYLTPSPELFIKRILATGVKQCYCFGKSYRNSEPQASLHNSEFTMLEYYKVGADYMELAEETLHMLQHITLTLFGKKELIFQGKKVDLTKWKKITVSAAFQKYAGIDEENLLDEKAFVKRAKEKGYNIDNASYEDLFSQIYTQEVEPHLGTGGFPTIIYDYPKEFAALAKLNTDGKTAQRFEFYIEGIELGNCYSELVDWHENEARFREEEKKRLEQKKIQHPTDEGFINALKNGLPSCSGIAIGVDRLAMIFVDAASIDDLKLISIR